MNNDTVNGPALHREKPVEIQAWHWDGTEESALAIIDWVGVHGSIKQSPDFVIQISTLEGIMTAEPGDWIIQDVDGEFYPCKPSIFAATYEASTTTKDNT